MPTSESETNISSFKKSFYPDVWDDDKRMDVLFAPFRTRSLNPENYDSKLNFWKDMIYKYCLEMGINCVNANELKMNFKRKNKFPYVFEKVFEEMKNSGEILIKEQFLEPPQHTWTGWAVDTLMKKPIKWSFYKVVQTVTQNKNENSEFIILKAIEDQCKNVLNKIEHSSESVMNLDSALEKCKELGLTIAGAMNVIHHLDCKQKILIDRSESQDDNSKILIKFGSVNKKVTPISDMERAIYNLEKTEKTLSKTIEQFDDDINKLDKQIRELIKENKKSTAKTILRKKKTMEINLKKREQTLENIQILLSRIHDTKSDENILKAYKLGSTTLKNILADSGITIDNVEDALADVQDTLELHDEIQSSLGRSQVDVDDIELEKELEDLLNDKNNFNDDGGRNENKESKVDDNFKDFNDSIERRLQELRTDFESISVDDKNANKIAE